VSEAPVVATATGVRLTLHVQPRAARTELAGLHGNAIKLRVAAPPVDGAANLEIIRFLAEKLSVAKSQVRIVAGAAGRRKVIDVSEVRHEAAQIALGVVSR